MLESIKKRKSKLEELCCAEEMLEIKEKQAQKLKEDVQRANLRFLTFPLKLIKLLPRTKAVKEELKEAHSRQLAIQGIVIQTIFSSLISIFVKKSNL